MYITKQLYKIITGDRKKAVQSFKQDFKLKQRIKREYHNKFPITFQISTD